MLYDEKTALARIRALPTDVKMELNHHVRNGLMNIMCHVRLGDDVDEAVAEFITRWEGLGL